MSNVMAILLIGMVMGCAEIPPTPTWEVTPEMKEALTCGDAYRPPMCDHSGCRPECIPIPLDEWPTPQPTGED